jgi:FKBP-type peptidyl-prolyl cis-trans isomerase
MKLINKLTAGILGLGLLVAAHAQNGAQPAPAQNPVKFDLPNVGGTNDQPASAAPVAGPVAAPAPVAPKYTEAQLMEVFGFVTGLRLSLAELEFTPEQIDAMARGMGRAARGEQPSAEMQGMAPELEAFMAKKQQAFMNKLRSHNLAEAAAFFTKLKENKNVQELPDGLRYEVTKPGTGAVPKAGQIAKIHYNGTFVNGQVFASSIQQGEPAEVFVQAPTKEDPRGVIPGMMEGLQKVSVGGKIKLYIPPHLAYGDEGTQGIPPAATLIFDVELLDVKDAPKEPAAAPAGK